MEREFSRRLDDAAVTASVEEMAKRKIRGAPRRLQMWKNSQLCITNRSIGSRSDKFPENSVTVVPRVVVGIAKKQRKSHVALAFAERSRTFTRVHLFGFVPLEELEKSRVVRVETATWDDLAATYEKVEDEEVEEEGEVPADQYPPRDRSLLEQVSLKDVALERIRELSLPPERRKSLPNWIQNLGRHILVACLGNDAEIYEAILDAEVAGMPREKAIPIAAAMAQAKKCYENAPLEPEMQKLRREIMEAKK